MAGRRILYLLLLTAATVYYFLDGEWFSYILLITLLFLPWLSLFISIRAMQKTRVIPRLAKKIDMGAKINCSFDLNCPLPVPPFRGKLMISVPHTQEKTILKEGDAFPTRHCGGLTVSLFQAKVYDYLGLFSKRIKNVPPMEICIFPKPVKILLPAELSRSLSQNLKPKAGGGEAENHDIRPYREGDTLGLIHWKLSAKLDDLVVREPLIHAESRIKAAMILKGDADELDRMLGQLLSLSCLIHEKEQSFELAVLTGNGREAWSLRTKKETEQCIRALLFSPHFRGEHDLSFAEKGCLFIGGENEP